MNPWDGVISEQEQATYQAAGFATAEFLDALGALPRAAVVA